MAPYLSILCGVDFSDHARNALRHAAVFAGRMRGRLVVTSVVDQQLAMAAAALYDKDYLKSETELDLRRFVSEALDGSTSWLPEPRLVVAVGRPHSAILEAATEERADLIVLGTQGLGGLKKLFFGSTTERVLREATVPVLAIPLAGAERISLDPSGPKMALSSVVAAVDFSVAATVAAREAAALARLYGVPLVLLHVVGPMLALPRWQDRLEAHEHERIAEAENRLAQVAGEIGGGGQVQTVVRIGTPADSIASVAREHDAGLITLGLRRDGLLQPHPGSIAYKVFCLAETPVLAVPYHGSDA